jgi:hypothetical protein
VRPGHVARGRGGADVVGAPVGCRRRRCGAGAGRRRRGGRGNRFAASGGCRRRGSVFIEHRQHLADLDVGTSLVRNRRQHAGPIRAHFQIDLLGLEFDQRIARRDPIADVLQPFRHTGFDHRLAQLGHHDIHS